MTVEHAFLWACHSELEALKVGNVHIYGEGHDMTVAQFITSAHVVAPLLGDATLSVGKRIRTSIEATHAAVGCNTNLGIVLLAAPIAAAAQLRQHSPQENLRPELQAVLTTLSQQDAIDAYAAIAMAYARYLGTSEKHDIQATPKVTLYQAMCHAQDRDLIAQQYATTFHDVYAQGVSLLKTNKHRPLRETITAMHLRFLSSSVDSHIVRQHGIDIAEGIRKQACHYGRVLAVEGYASVKKGLLAWDKELKARKINPGACADLVVASLMLFFIENLQNRL
ncbi:MAG: triphosphoribosyl-dephospho-CoA synthase [Alphaproteobacteria bacterium GM202ARS2]|nr:triphosphoribosyl-dephospho-CoA synthase [Alphaproteobacteria bacterium GM202ARS2]